MKIIKILVVVSMMLLVGCGKGRTLVIAEIEKHSQRCINNEGIKEFGIYVSNKGYNELKIVRVTCNDGAVFYISNS